MDLPGVSRFLFLVAAFGCATFGSRGVGAQEPDDSWTLIIDLPSISADTLMSEVVRAVAGFEEVRAWNPRVIRPNETLTGIVNDQYRFYQSDYPETTAVLTNLIAAMNNLPDPDQLRPGDTLRLPSVGQRPSFDAQEGVTQFILPSRDSAAVFRTDRSVRPGMTALPSELPARMGRTWSYRLSPNELGRFVNATSPALLRKIRGSVFLSPGTQTIEIQLLGPSATTDAAHERPGATQAPSPGQPAGLRYYVLDVFGPPGTLCNHGDAVLEVARATLSENGGESLSSGLIPLNVDFYADTTTAKVNIQEYMRALGPDARDHVWRTTRALLDDLPESSGQLTVPVLYLQALYYRAAQDPSAVVVSGSYWTRFDTFWAMMPFIASEGQLLFLNAVTDLTGNAVEDAVLYEPIHTFYRLRHDYPVALVGAETQPGITYGMESYHGDGVATLGRGTGWGGGNTCIKPDDVGTSFSTPHIGALLFAAAAQWRDAGESPTALDARTRLLLSGKVRKEYVGRYGSAGVPDFERLKQPRGAYAIDSSGGLVHLEDLTGELRLRDPADASGESFPVVLNRSRWGIRALQLVGSEVLVFHPSEMRWMQVMVDQIRLTFQHHGRTEVITSLRQFSGTYSGVFLQ